MEGFYFYWIAWIAWIYLTFIMEKGRRRLWLSVWVLTSIACSNSIIIVSRLPINLVIFILYLGAIIALATTKHWISNLFYSFCLVFGYVGFLFWEQVSPVWLFVPKLLMVPFLGVILLVFFTRSFFDRLLISVLGLSTGELVHGFILHGYGFSQPIGDLTFLDLLCIQLGFLFIVEIVKEIKEKIDSITTIIEKQKKKVKA